MKDFAFKFPLENSFSKVEIPFAFQQNLEENNGEDRFHSYITIKDTPKLYLDISDDKKMDKFLLSSTIENLKASNQKQENKLQLIDTNIMQVKTENDKMREEIENIKNEILLRTARIEYLKKEVNTKSQNNQKMYQELNDKINEKNSRYFLLKQKYENLEKEIYLKNYSKTEDKKVYLKKIKDEINKIQKDYHNSFKYYNNKFMNNCYSDDYIKTSLQSDLVDFKEYVSGKINSLEDKVQAIIKYIQTSVNESIGEDYEVKLYGSHATSLCLPWSDIDVVLCKKNVGDDELSSANIDYYLPLHELFLYLTSKNIFKSINYIGSTSVPLIKIKTKENFGNQSIDISLQDKTHYGIKCVSLILSFKKEYEVLMPMILALKNILKQANLNDPYKGGLSSYGLVLLVVHFLKKQQEEMKPVNQENGNLGRLFYEFLLYYGTEFDPKESIIDPKGLFDQDEYIDRAYYAQQSDLIIIDPLNSENNVAKNTRQFNNIRLAFMIGAISAKEDCECGCHYENENPISHMSIQHCILKRIFYAVKRYSSDNNY